MKVKNFYCIQCGNNTVWTTPGPCSPDFGTTTTTTEFTPPCVDKFFKNFRFKGTVTKKVKAKTPLQCLNKCKVFYEAVFLFSKQVSHKSCDCGCVAINWKKKKNCFLLSDHTKKKSKKKWVAAKCA